MLPCSIFKRAARRKQEPEAGPKGGYPTRTLYAYNSGHGLYTLITNTTELKITPITGTNPSDIISLGYSANLKMAGVDSVSGHVYTGTISGTSVTWTTVSQNIHPLTLYSVQAITGISGSHTIVYETGLKGEVLYDSIVSTGNTSVELIPPTTRTLYDVGLVTGNNGYLIGDSTSIYNFPHYRGISVSGYSPSYTQYKPAVASTNPLYDISINGTTAYIAGASGTVYYINNTASPTVTLASSGSGTNNFVGITNVGSGAIAVGSNSQMWMYGGTSAMQITSLHTPGFNAVNFQADALHGYAVGDSSTIRRSDDGGNTWQLVLPDLSSYVKSENYNTVWTTGTGQAIVAGNGNFLGSTSSSNQVSHYSGYTYNSSSSQSWNKIRFNQNHLDSGYLVGSSKGILNLGVSSAALSSVSTFSPGLPSGAGSSALHALHIFRDNSFLVAGSGGISYYYNPNSTPRWINENNDSTTTRYNAFTWNDSYFRDDRTGYLVGDSVVSGTHYAGEILKTISPINIQPQSPATISTFLTWNMEPVEDGFNIVSPVNINYNCIAFSGVTSGFVGGAYSATFTNSSNYPNARLINDMGGLYSSNFYYDRLGRLIVQQDTKQHNYKRPAYSYTLYDQLNRITEVGQKTENTSTTKFSTIFGDTVLSSVPNPSIISPSKFLTWVKDATGPRTEVSHSYWDVQDILPTKVLVQNELRNRVAAITYTDTLRTDSTIYNNGIFKSYDVHGNIQTLIQDDSVYNVGTGQRYKRVDYQYDLVSGNVNEVDYQNDSLDQYHHRYTYDADNRMIQVQTSKDSVNWDNDASYFYYLHGSLARTELGDQQVQGMDYAYTLHTWLKGVNSDKLTASVDMGEDGLTASGNLNSGFARDAMGYTLKYFDKSSQFPGDYDAIDTSRWNHVSKRFEAYTYGSDLTNSRRDLFNGNITAVNTTIQKPQTYSESSVSQQAIVLPQGTAYGYDQLNRMVEMKAFRNLDTATNTWGTTGSFNGRFHNWLSYDANGNILTQKRADSTGNVFDSLTYHYNNINGMTVQNRLYHVNDAIAGTVDGVVNDIRDEGTFNSTEIQINQKNNYRYNAIGELAKDIIGGLDTIIWTNYGKQWKIKKYNGDSIIFSYDGRQDLIQKKYKPASGNPVNTYYIHDAQGNILSIYIQQGIGMSMSYLLTERDIFGTQRIGAEKTPVQLCGATAGIALKVDTFNRYLGNKEYELDSHLGSILGTVSDRKIPRPNSAHDSVSYYQADLISSQDYFPFGYEEPNRNYSSSAYNYGFDGKLKTDEIYGAGNSYYYNARTFDPRLGRFVSTDVLTKKYPWLSPYQFAGNDVMRFIDLDGKETVTPMKPGENNNGLYTSAIDNARAGFVGEYQILKANTFMPEQWHSEQTNPIFIAGDYAERFLNGYQGTAGFKKLGVDLSQTAAPVVKGAGVVVSVVGFPEVGIPLYKAGGYIQDAGNAIQFANALKEGDYKGAAVDVGANVIGKLVGAGADKLPIKDNVRKFGAAVLADKAAEKIVDKGKEVLNKTNSKPSQSASTSTSGTKSHATGGTKTGDNKAPAAKTPSGGAAGSVSATPSGGTSTY